MRWECKSFEKYVKTPLLPAGIGERYGQTISIIFLAALCADVNSSEMLN
jgi:hypothetical protein